MVGDGSIRVVEALQVQLNSCNLVPCWIRISGDLNSVTSWVCISGGLNFCTFIPNYVLVLLYNPLLYVLTILYYCF